ncbi:MAG TPA: peptidyl-prolyl cis-trans isomerase [Verrucomicrobiales bacterium]|jgi:parvulin-like peptidyl-prolyl isomerase|nr:peptidyl-prolyl cis-trans isomerase [Verrucomicrobiales bacterium]
MSITVNGEPVPNDLINEEFQAIKAHYERMGRASCCERDPEFRGYAKDNIIARILLNQEAERQFKEISEEDVTATLERLIGEHGGRETFFSNVGLTPDQEPLVREDLRAGLRVDRLMQQTWGGTGPPDESAQRTWYQERIAEFMTPEEVSALHLFKHVEKVEDRETVYNLLRSLRAQARAGADFKAMALEHTDKEDKLVDLGWFKRGDFMEEFDLIIFSLEAGETSPVFASHWGFHLAQVTGHRPPAPIPFGEVQAQVVERMTAEHRQGATQALVTELKARAEIIDDTPVTAPAHEHE